MISTDLSRVWFMCQRAIQVTQSRDTVGKIVNIGSMDSFFDGTTMPVHSIAEGAMIQFPKSIASGCVNHSIYYNVIVPDYMDMEICVSMSRGHRDEYTKRIAAGRWSRSENLKGLILFLASSTSGYLSGTVIPVDGGFLMKS